MYRPSASNYMGTMRGYGNEVRPLPSLSDMLSQLSKEQPEQNMEDIVSRLAKVQKMMGYIKPDVSSDYEQKLSAAPNVYYGPPNPKTTPKVPSGVPSWLPDVTRKAAGKAGVPTNWADSPALYQLLKKESGYRPTAQNPTSTAYGLYQFLNCFIDGYEALTSNGWKPIKDIEVGELILGLTRYDGMKWHVVKDVLYEDYDGPVIKLEGKSFEATVTPNHKWVSCRCYSEGHRSGREIPQTEKGQWLFMIDGSPWQLTETKDLNSSYRIRRYVDKLSIGTNIVSNELAALAGWYSTEGYCQKTYAIISQSNKNPEKVEEIRALLRHVGAEWVEDVSDYDNYESGINLRITTTWLGDFLKTVCPGKDKAPTPTFLSMLTQEAAIAMLDAVIKGDGWVMDNGTRRIAAKSKTSMDSYQMLATLAGECASVKQTPGDGMYRATLLKSSNITYADLKVATLDYKGKIVCLEANGTFVARSPQGSVFITGNSTWKGTGIKKTSDPLMQSIAGLKYIKNRYGSPEAALKFHLKHNWY